MLTKEQARQLLQDIKEYAGFVHGIKPASQSEVDQFENEYRRNPYVMTPEEKQRNDEWFAEFMQAISELGKNDADT